MNYCKLSLLPIIIVMKQTQAHGNMLYFDNPMGVLCTTFAGASMDHQTIQLPHLLSVIQVNIQLLDHSAIGELLAHLPDMSDNRMSTVLLNIVRCAESTLHIVTHGYTKLRQLQDFNQRTWYKALPFGCQNICKGLPYPYQVRLGRS